MGLKENKADSVLDKRSLLRSDRTQPAITRGFGNSDIMGDWVSNAYFSSDKGYSPSIGNTE